MVIGKLATSGSGMEQEGNPVKDNQRCQSGSTQNSIKPG